MTTQLHSTGHEAGATARIHELRSIGAPAGTAPARTRLRLTHRGQVALIVLVTVLLAIVMSMFVMGTTGANAAAQSGAADHVYISIQAGETLWQIAEELDPNADPRDLIAEIVSLNDLPSSTLEAGQRIALPLRFS